MYNCDIYKGWGLKMCVCVCVCVCERERERERECVEYGMCPFCVCVYTCTCARHGMAHTAEGLMAQGKQVLWFPLIHLS